jgi:hypothetical protein
MLFWFVTKPTQSKSSFMIFFFAKYKGRVLESFLLVFEKSIYMVSPLLNPQDYTLTS